MANVYLHYAFDLWGRDKVYRREVLEEAWQRVRRNRGSAGVDKQTIAAVEGYGVDRLLNELETELREKRYHPQPVRRVYIPKPGKPGQQRGLGIPVVRDRVVQAAVKLVIEPVLEADFPDCSYGFRPERGCTTPSKRFGRGARGATGTSSTPI